MHKKQTFCAFRGPRIAFCPSVAAFIVYVGPISKNSLRSAFVLLPEEIGKNFNRKNVTIIQDTSLSVECKLVVKL